MTAPAPADPRGVRRTVALSVGIFVVVRLLMLLVITLVAHAHHRGAMHVLTKADGLWYLRIAAHGYGHPPPIGPNGAYTHVTPLAFFPLYPGLIRAVSAIGIAMPYAALLVTAAAGIVAVVFIALWARPYVGDRGAIVLVAVWSMLPTSAVLDMAYSEALFVAAAAGALLAVQRERWISAALGCTVAGLTRPTAAGLVLGVLIAIGLDVRRNGLRPRPVAAALLAPAGMVISLGHVAVATGRIDGWFWLERTVWNSGFDGGWSWLRSVGQVVTGGRATHFPPVVMSAAVVIAFVVVFVLWARRRPPAAELTYTATAAVMAIGERNYVHVKPRFLLVAFPVLVPVARALARWPATVLVAVAVPVLAASLAWNAYIVVIWPRSV